MNPNVRINKISLTNFRNHKNTRIENTGTFMVLNGKNGSGKTNILEAISFFSPGRGIKNSSVMEIIRKSENINSCEFNISIKYDTGEVDLKRYFSIDEKKGNYITIDDEKVNNSQLLDFVNIIWITPIMEKIMLQSNSEKRNFFDRLIFNVDKNHLKNHTKLQKLLSERLALLKNYSYDKEWLSILENTIAELSIKIMTNRKNFLFQLNKELSKAIIPFGPCIIDMQHGILNFETDINQIELIESYRSILESTRKIDSELNRTTQNINKVKIEIYNNSKKNIEAKNCSTGEQKSILLSIFVAVARIIKLKNNGRSPIMLIDEAMAHLDLAHKEYLFNELSNLESQVWLSGVSKELFNNINYQTVFIDMKNIV